MNYFGAVIDPVYFPHLEVIGDIGNAIWQLCERIKESPPSWDTRCLLVIPPYLTCFVALQVCSTIWSPDPPLGIMPCQ